MIRGLGSNLDGLRWRWARPGTARLPAALALCACLSAFGCAGLALCACLSACGSLGFGGSSDEDAPAAPPSPTKQFLENLALGGPAPATTPAPNAQTRFPDAVKQKEELDCPVLDVAANGAAMRDFAGGSEAGAQALRHQISITNLARECKDAGTNISMKLGVEGSVLL